MSVRSETGPGPTVRVGMACDVLAARHVEPLALAAYEEARARQWPFLSDVLERILRGVAETDRADVTAVVHALVKYDRLLEFATVGGSPAERFQILLSLAGGDTSAVAERLDRIPSPRERLGVEFSFPNWIVDLVESELGPAALPRALARMNESAPRVARVNTLTKTRAACLQDLRSEGIDAKPAALAPNALVFAGQRSPFRTQAFARGDFEMQDEASQLVADVVAPPPGSLVVDACAGAGGKTLALAALLAGKGRVIALDASEDKLAELRRRARRAQANNVRAITVDLHAGAARLAEFEGRAARVLLDAPCSGLGALRRNPEARWRLSASDLARLVETQAALLQAVSRLVAPRGRLVYATCSFLPSEGERAIEAFLAGAPEFGAVTVRDVLGKARSHSVATADGKYLRTWRFEETRDGGDEGMDGFFAAVLRRRAPRATEGATEGATEPAP
jgi:16S rRNA (cytosine967-C5)-methyltransferase